MRKWFSSVTGMAAAPAAGTATLCQRRSTLCAPANTRYRRQKVGKMIELTPPDGHKWAAYRAEPKGKPRGGLIVVQEIFGVNGHIKSIADGYAADGYLAVAPAFFDRVERGLDIGYTPPDIERGRAFIPKMQWDKVMLDAGAALADMKSSGKIGIVGYCWGGTGSWMAAARLLSLACAVCYYGGRLTHQPRVFLVLGAHQRVELLGRTGADAHAESGDLLVDLGRRDRGDDAGVELRDDVPRRSSRYQRAEHRGHIEIGNAELGDGRDVRQGARALAVGAREDAHLSRPGALRHRGIAAERDLHVPRDQPRPAVSHSLVGHVHHLDSGKRFEEFRCDVMDRAVARRRVGELPGILFRVGDEFRVSRRRDRRVDREEGRQGRDRADSSEILERPVGHFRV